MISLRYNTIDYKFLKQLKRVLLKEYGKRCSQCKHNDSHYTGWYWGCCVCAVWTAFDLLVQEGDVTSEEERKLYKS